MIVLLHLAACVGALLLVAGIVLVAGTIRELSSRWPDERGQ